MIYLSIALLYILLSDILVSQPPLSEIPYLHTYKGFAFVITSALVIYVLILKAAKQQMQAQIESERAASRLAEIERNLFVSRQRLEALAETIPGLVFITDQTGQNAYTNSTAQNYFQRTREELLQQEVMHQMLHPDQVEEVLAKWEAAIQEGKPFHSEILFQRGRDGRYLWHLVHTLPVRDKDGNIIAWTSVGLDIDELHSERERARAASIAKDEFLSLMSHELRTPMNAIFGFSDLLAQSELSRMQNSWISYIQEASERLRRVIGDILDYVQLQARDISVKEEDIIVDDLIDIAIQRFHTAAAAKQLNIVVERQADAPQIIHTDQARLLKIVDSLLSNAIKFSPRDNVVTLRLGQTPRNGTNEQFCLDMIDCGEGISEEYREAVFSPFFQIDSSSTREHGGTGLGLTLARRLAERLGGNVLLIRSDTSGSCFRLTLPCSPLPADAPSQRQKEQEGQVPDPAANRILLVEDDIPNQIVVCELAMQSGYTIDVVETGAALKARLAADSFSLILMDLTLPAESGLELTQSIRSGDMGVANVGITIVGLTASADDETRRNCMEAGMNDFLAKPLGFEELKAALHRNLAPARPTA